MASKGQKFNKYTDEYKKEIIEKFQNGASFTYLAKEYGISRFTILTWIRKINKFILCKNYWGDNEFIPYFVYNIRRLIITGFYKNIKKLENKSDDLKQLLKANNINLKTMKLKNKKDINILYHLLKLISICNANDFCLIYLFYDFNYSMNDLKETYNLDKNKSLVISEKQYITQWEFIIKNYDKKKDAFSSIISSTD